MPNPPSQTCSGPIPQPIGLINQLFKKMSVAYGASFLDKWANVDSAALKQQWAEDLAGLTVEQIEAGFARRPAKFPPDSKEFALLCNPPLDLEAQFHIAVKQMQLRKEGRDNWPNAALFYAATEIGSDLLSQPYVHLKRRWEAALYQAQEDIRLCKKSAARPSSAVPESRHLAAPGKTITDRDTARKTLAETKQWMKDHGYYRSGNSE